MQISGHCTQRQPHRPALPHTLNIAVFIEQYSVLCLQNNIQRVICDVPVHPPFPAC